MIKLMRKGHKWLLTGIILLLGVSFIFYFSNTDVGTAMSGQHLGEIYDRPVSQTEFQHSGRLFNLARDLGMFAFLQDMVGGAQSEAELYTDFTWNRLILHHESERLGIRPLTHEIAKVVRDLRAFRGDAGFDMNKYTEFTQNVLPAMGFTEAHIEELAADQLRLTKLKDLVATGVHISEIESQQNYDRAYGKLTVSVARLKTEEIAKDVTIPEEDITKYYEQNKEQLTTEEKRKLNFVSFALDEEQKKLTGRERVEVLQKLADRANDFNQALLEKGANFHELAVKFQLPIQVTGEFTRANPDPLLATNPQLADAAFRLTPEEPNTDALQGGDGFYVLNLAGIDAARPLSLEEARPQIVERLKNEKTRMMVAEKGAEAARKIREALTAGAAAEAAIQQAGFQPEKLPTFAISDAPAMRVDPGKQPEPETPDLQMIKASVADLNPGEVSDFIPTGAGGVVAVLQGRERPTAGAADQTREAFNSRVISSKKQIAFLEWLRERRREAGVKEAEPITATSAG